MHKEYRDEWETAGYSRYMGSAEVARPPSREFLRGYHLTSASHALSDIALGRLKIARFSDANDPFELLALNFRESRARKIVRDFKDAYGATTGFLSFSRNWTSPVLWSHYGDKHRGICLGFNLRRNNPNLQHIEYQDKRVASELGRRPVHPDPNQLDGPLQTLLLRTKFSHWEYEQEVRIMVPLASSVAEGRLHFFPFDEGLHLCEVILGPLCDHSVHSVRKLVTSLHPGTMVFKSRLAIGSFDVVPKESTVP